MTRPLASGRFGYRGYRGHCARDGSPPSPALRAVTAVTEVTASPCAMRAERGRSENEGATSPLPFTCSIGLPVGGSHAA
jgi:hypothetical protein